MGLNCHIPVLLLSAVALLSSALGDAGSIFIDCGAEAADESVSDEGLFKGRLTDYAFTKRNVSAPAGWKPAWKKSLKTHRYAFFDDLEYEIPAHGSYKVTLLFAETWGRAEKVGVREFTIALNGMPTTYGPNKVPLVVDVFKMAGSAFLGYGLETTEPVQSEDGYIHIKLGRIEGKNNPMVCGILLTPYPHLTKTGLYPTAASPSAAPSRTVPPFRPSTLDFLFRGRGPLPVR